MPSIHYTLPHVVQSPKSLSPAFKWSKGRSNVSMVLGIPTVMRDNSYKRNYLQVKKSQSKISIFKNILEQCEFLCPIFRAASEQNLTYCIVANSNARFYLGNQLFVQRSQYMRTENPLHEQSEKICMCF